MIFFCYEIIQQKYSYQVIEYNSFQVAICVLQGFPILCTVESLITADNPNAYSTIGLGKTFICICTRERKQVI